MTAGVMTGPWNVKLYDPTGETHPVPQRTDHLSGIGYGYPPPIYHVTPQLKPVVHVAAKCAGTVVSETYWPQPPRWWPERFRWPFRFRTWLYALGPVLTQHQVSIDGDGRAIFVTPDELIEVAGWHHDPAYDHGCGYTQIARWKWGSYVEGPDGYAASLTSGLPAYPLVHAVREQRRNSAFQLGWPADRLRLPTDTDPGRIPPARWTDIAKKGETDWAPDRGSPDGVCYGARLRLDAISFDRAMARLGNGPHHVRWVIEDLRDYGGIIANATKPTTHPDGSGRISVPIERDYLTRDERLLLGSITSDAVFEVVR